MASLRGIDFGVSGESNRTSHNISNVQATASSGNGSTDTVKRRNRHSNADWERKKLTIIQLYVEDELKTEEVLEALKEVHNFPVGRRKFLDMIKMWGLKKNFEKSEMMILLAKQDARTRMGRQTRFYRNGRLINEERLQRFRVRDPGYLGAPASPSMPTPAGFSYKTPKLAEDGSPSLERSRTISAFEETFEGSHDVTTVQAYRPARLSDVLDRSHIHQIGAFAYSYFGKPPITDSTKALERVMDLGNLFMDWIRHSPPLLASTTRNGSAARPGVPRFWFKSSQQTLRSADTLRNRIMLQLQNSSFITHELLHLRDTEILLWRKKWAYMTAEEYESISNLSATHFGATETFYSKNDLIQAFVTMHSPRDHMSFVFLGVSIAVSQHEDPCCGFCEKDAMSLDILCKGRALQVNVPLRNKHTYISQPENWLISETTERGSCLRFTKGWSVHTSCKLHRDAVLDEPCTLNYDSYIETCRWDPVAVSGHRDSFQPYISSDQASKHLCESFRMNEEIRNREQHFMPNQSSQERWDPSGQIRVAEDISDSDSD
ncbi:hypothetical protein BKA58DRAFT_465036 [Alternaria rosae]|uniref:uncharacterized protein n=1 Tax=Alternaria rosae TaxID=1187941 RepID=UPI001E8E88E9|nr:uncharacterized protein BKA58DRAFT_465036 [Alternaria rosae]KAH6883169.1 hypothetical protein BKA58DRAFT_465036 [Alternaria rosae]